MVEKLYLISKGGLWYRPNAQGYTSNPDEAGRYTLEEAIDHTHPNGPDGPRDGMAYKHESEVASPTAAKDAEIEALRARVRELERLLGVVQSGLDEDFADEAAIKIEIRAALQDPQP